MARKIDEIVLDLSLDSVELWGHDSCLEKLNYELLGLAIESGCVLPRVDVVFQDGAYQLLYGNRAHVSENYAGHSRSKAVLSRGGVLACNLWDEHLEKPFISHNYKSWKRLSGMEVKENRSTLSLRRIEDNFRFLPDDLVQSFMRENDLLLTSYGALEDARTYNGP